MRTEERRTQSFFFYVRRRAAAPFFPDPEPIMVQKTWQVAFLDELPWLSRESASWHFSLLRKFELGSHQT
jgi:hypothetical protein